MKKTIIRLLILSCVFGLLPSCDNSSSTGDFPPFKIKRLDLDLADYASMDTNYQKRVDSTMNRGISVIKMMFNIGHPDDSAFIKYVHSPAIKMFSPIVKEKFPQLDNVENILGGVKQNLAKELPDIKMSELYSFVSPYNQSIYIPDGDSTMLIALNHYLGKEHEAYKGRFDEYQCKLKEPCFIPYDIIEAMIATTFYYMPSGEETLLNKMLYQGAIVEAKMRLIPDASLALALGYDEEQLDWLENNQQKAWEALVSKNLLYSKSLMDFERLFNPSPSTSILHPEAPGRAGRYLGYKIVKAYLQKNPGTTLTQLLSPQFYSDNQSFISSSYQGK